MWGKEEIPTSPCKQQTSVVARAIIVVGLRLTMRRKWWKERTFEYYCRGNVRNLLV